MHPSIDNDRGIAAVRNALETRANKTPSTDCIIESFLKFIGNAMISDLGHKIFFN